MKGRSLLLLFAACVGLGFYLYYGVQKPSETREADKEKESRLARGDLRQLKQVSISANGIKIDLEKAEGAQPVWRMIAPSKDLAASSKIESLISALERFKKTKVIYEKSEIQAQKEKLAQFGLTPPKLRVEYKTADLSDPVQIFLGGSNPSSSGTYTQVGGSDSEVLLATMDLDFLTTQVPDDFREMRLTTVDPMSFAEVEIQSNGKRMKFVRTPDDRWTMTAPYKDLPIDIEYTRSELQKISYIRANKFIETMPEALKNPDIRVLIGFKENVTDERTSVNDPRPKGVEILFGRAARKLPKLKIQSKSPDKNDEYEYYAKSDKTSPATLARYHYDTFLKPPEDYIRKTFEIFDPSQVQKMVIRSAKMDSITVERVKDTYEVTQGTQKKAGSKDAIENALRQIRGLRAVKFTQVFDALPSAPFWVEIETTQGQHLKFAFQFEKDFSDLWFVDGSTKMRYLLAKDPLRLKEFDFSALTAASAQKVDSKLDPVKDLVKPSETTLKEPAKH